MCVWAAYCITNPRDAADNMGEIWWRNTAGAPG